MNELTQLLRGVEQGERSAGDRLLELVYGELHHLAAAKMAREPAGQTLQTTALVHEAWLRLGGDQQPAWENRAHFFGAAAEAMRRVLIDRARKRQARRHGGGQQKVDLNDVALDLATPESDDQVLAINDALERLALEEPRQAELVKLRYFAGLTIEEAAKALGISPATAKRWWAYARAWLYEETRP